MFGSIHIAAWNLTFPIPVEQTLWRIYSILLIVRMPFPFLLIIGFYSDKHFVNDHDFPFQAWIFSWSPVYRRTSFYIGRILSNIDVQHVGEYGRC